MSTITRESGFILLKVIKRHEDKRPEGRTELAKLKARLYGTAALNYFAKFA